MKVFLRGIPNLQKKVFVLKFPLHILNMKVIESCTCILDRHCLKGRKKKFGYLGMARAIMFKLHVKPILAPVL